MHERLLRKGCMLIGACLMGGVTIGWTPSAHAQDLSFYDEVFFSLRYDRSVDEIVNALYDGEAFFLSLQDVFEPLQLDVNLDLANQVASGFYIDERRTYEIRFAEQQAHIGRRTVTFDSTDFVQAPLGFFLRPALMDSIFGFTTNVDLRSLSIAIESSEPLPIDLASARASSRRFLGPMEIQDEAPLLYDRNRSILKGGVLGYSLGASSINNEQLYRVDLTGGLEAMGGDLQGNLQGVFAETGATLDYTNVQWRFVPRARHLLSQIKAGEVNSKGLRTLRYRGAQFSNAPVKIQRVFGYQQFEGRTEPGWEVELLINNQLVDFTTADETGHYAFAVPVTYGTTLTTIRMYGPNGQFEETERRLQVPFSFVPVGKIYYDLDVGQTLDQDQALAQFGASIGLSSWLTTSVGAEYIGAGATNGQPERFQPIGEVTARLLHHHLVSIEVAPGALVRGSINAFYPSLATFSVQYTRFAGTTLYNQSNRDQVIEIQSSFPIQVGSVPINFRINGRQNTFRQQQVYTLRPGFSAQFLRGLRVNATYRLGATDGPEQPLEFGTGFLDGGVNYAISRQARAPKWLRGVLASARFGYDTQRKQLNNTALSISRNVGTFGRIRIGTTYNVTARSFNSDVQFSLNLPTARTTTAVRSGAGNTSFSQDVSGAIGWDGVNRDFVMEQQNWVGSASASVRMFVDGNGNDTYDKGEQVIKDGVLRFRQSIGMQNSKSGIARAHNLRAYDQYSVSIDKNSIRNPLWVPKVDSFSFVADPNRFKQLDIPFYVSGIVEGSVMQQRSSGLVPIPGMRVHILSVEKSSDRTIPVFRDGQFFEMELRPGDYVAHVDSSQMAVLGVTSDPPIYPFTIKVTEDGDWVSGIDFILHTIEKEPELETSPVLVVDNSSIQPEQSETIGSRESEQNDPAGGPISAPIQDALGNAPDSERTSMPEDLDQQVAEVRPRIEESTNVESEEVALQEIDIPGQVYRLYVVEPNEAGLAAIAQKVYGDEAKWVDIWEANKDKVPNPNVITSGTVLRVPEEAVSTEAVVTEYIVQSSDRGLMDIARKVYLDSSLWVKIWVANQAVLGEPHLIEVGQRLSIPEKAPLTAREHAARARLVSIEDSLRRINRASDPSMFVAGEVLHDFQDALEEPAVVSSVTTEYTVQSSDRGLMDIARKVYLDSSLWVKIWVANQAVLGEPHLIEVGQRLSIPEKAPLTARERAAKASLIRPQ